MSTDPVYGGNEATAHRTVVYRLSQIGDALPLEHLHPTDDGEERRRGAQCFATLREALGKRSTGMDGDYNCLLALHVRSGLGWDEDGWVVVEPEDVISVRRACLSDLDIDALRDLYLDADEERDAVEAMEPVNVQWVHTV